MSNRRTIKVITEIAFTINTDDLPENATDKDILDHFNRIKVYGKRDMVMDSYADSDGKILLTQDYYKTTTEIGPKEHEDL
jgi:hypothetical protein